MVQSQSGTIVSTRSLFIGLMGLTMLYQLSFQISMWRAVQKETENICGGIGINMDASQMCIELRLFQDWKETAAKAPHTSDDMQESEDELQELLLADAHATSSSQSTPTNELSIDSQLTMMAEWEGSTDVDLLHLQEILETRHMALLAAQMQHTDEIKSAPPVVSDKQDTSFRDKIRQLHSDLCSDPKRHDNPGCAETLAHQDAALHTDTKKYGTAEAWQAVVSTSLTDLNRELCQDLQSRGYNSSACSPMLFPRNASSSAAPAAPEAPLAKDVAPAAGTTTSAAHQVSDLFLAAKAPPEETRTEVQRVHWRSVKEWVPLAKDGLVSVRKADLVGLKWSGMIPSVACIAAIPDGRAAQARLKYFINNFLLQQYEGPKQLVLVYHRSDERAAKLVKAYADGSYIKGVAAFGDGEFPSTTAFRYGAWSADADIIAHWDFDEWHHPDRLAMQIRALGLTGRPASILKQWTVLQEGQQSTLFAGVGWEGSLVGEAKWMHEHWHPLLQEERVVLESGRDHHLAQVAMPELSVYNAGSDDWASVMRHFGRENTVDISANDLASMEKDGEIGQWVGGLWRMPKELESRQLSPNDIKSVTSQESGESSIVEATSEAEISDVAPEVVAAEVETRSVGEAKQKN